MALIDTYKDTMLKKREEIAKLDNDLSKVQEKISVYQKKIVDAKSIIKRTKNESTIKTKMRAIQNAEESITGLQKQSSNIQKRITQKEGEYSTAEKNYRREEKKNTKKENETEKRRQKELDKQNNDFARSLKQQEQTQIQIKKEIDQLKALPGNITVLFLASNPIDTERLALDEEARAIQQKIREAKYRDSISLETRWAVRSLDILQAINETNPTIIHFSGHGCENGEIVLLNSEGKAKFVSREAISMTVSTASDIVRLVVFNECFSAEQANNVVKYIDAAIGMPESIKDESACIFAAQLYSSIGFGQSLKTSFDQAIAALMLEEDIQEENIPRLYIKPGVDPEDIVFVES